MASVINYFKKKIQKPFKRCVFDSSSSFVQNDLSREKNRRDQSSHLQVNNLTITKSQIESTDQSRLSKAIAKSKSSKSKLRFFSSSKVEGKMSQMQTEDNIAIKASSYYCTPDHSPTSDAHAVSCVNLDKMAQSQITPISISPEYAQDGSNSYQTFSEDNAAHVLYNTPVSSAHSSSTPSLSISARNRKIKLLNDNSGNSMSYGASAFISKTPSAPNSSPMSSLCDSIPFNNHEASVSSFRRPPCDESSLMPKAAMNPPGKIQILLNDESNLNAMSSLSNNSNSMQQSTPCSGGSDRTKLIGKLDAKSSNADAKNEKQTSIYSTSELETPQVSSIALHGNSLHNLNGRDIDSEFTRDNEGHYDLAGKKKCQRSNTTFTVKLAKDDRRNKIIEYFNQMQFNGNQGLCKAKSSENYFAQGSTNGRPLNQKLFEKTADDEDENKCEDEEMEKIQDALFKDESYMSTGSKKLKTDISSFLLQSSLSSSSTASSLASIDRSNENIHATSAEKTSEEKPPSIKKLNDETHLVNKSIEKMRRSLSMPGLNDHNTTIFSNASKISTIKDIETEVSATFDDVSKDQQEQKTELDTNELGTFVRGDAQTRMSSNIKNMFNNVRKYQMNALNCLEKYHESQLNKLEIERNTRLLLNPAEKDQINAFYNKQKAAIEQRIYANLCFITQSKSAGGSSNGSLSSQKSASDLVNQGRYSTESSKSTKQSIQQMHMLQAQKAQNGPKNIQHVKRPVIQQQRKQQSKSRAKSLSGLKSNIINQKSMLASKSQTSAFNTIDSRPSSSSYSKFKMNKINSTSNEEFERDNFFMNMRSKEDKSTTQDFDDERTGLSSIHDSNMQQHVSVETDNSCMFEVTNNFVFKRHLSLPYDKCSKVPAQVRRPSNPTTEFKAPPAKTEPKANSNFNSLVYSASKIKYYKKSNGGMNNSSTFTSGVSLANTSREQDEMLKVDSSFASKNSSVGENTSFLTANGSSKLNSAQTQFHYMKNRIAQKAATNDTFLKSVQGTREAYSAQPPRHGQVPSYAQIRRLTGSPTSVNLVARRTANTTSPVTFGRPIVKSTTQPARIVMKKETEV